MGVINQSAAKNFFVKPLQLGSYGNDHNLERINLNFRTVHHNLCDHNSQSINLNLICVIITHKVYKCISDFWHLCKMSDIVDCITGYRTEFFPGKDF